jgi:hypothetical protein
MSGTTAGMEQEFARFIVLYEAKDTLRLQAKAVNQEFKLLNERIHQYLLQQQGNAKTINARYAIHLRVKNKVSGLNAQLIGEGYAGFHTSIGRTSSVDETTAYLVFLKALRKTKTEPVYDVNVVVTQ